VLDQTLADARSEVDDMTPEAMDDLLNEALAAAPRPGRG
jgi:hypothetical protein